jgi:hypothetical protein
MAYKKAISIPSTDTLTPHCLSCIFAPEWGSDYEFLDQKRKRKVQEMKKLIHKFDIKINDLGLQA